MANEKILKVINELQKISDYEQENKDKSLEKDRMLAITRDTGEFYNILLKSMKATKVLEIGLSHGYSTLWFADSILHNNSEDCKIISIDNDSKKIQKSKENFKRAGIEDIIKIQHGNAMSVLSKMRQAEQNAYENYFDFVFIDADKENSINYFEICFPMLRKNGIIAADNVLDMQEMKEYVDFVKKRKDINSVTLPIGWGQELSIKL